MKAIARRLAALEAFMGGPSSPRYWVRLIGRTEAEAKASYEAENGPVPPDAGIIFRKIVEPTRRPLPRG